MTRGNSQTVRADDVSLKDAEIARGKQLPSSLYWQSTSNWTLDGTPSLAAS